VEHPKRTSVLVVDDEEDVRSLFKELLEEWGYLCHTAPDGVAALEKLACHPIDLALVDIIMPGMGGLRFSQEAKERFPKLGIIFITALEDLTLAVRQLKTGALDYLVKPISPKRLRAAVEDALQELMAMNTARVQQELLIQKAQEAEAKERELKALNRLFQQYLTEAGEEKPRPAQE
jgi:DNA-binding NtrC family response regulator